MRINRRFPRFKVIAIAVAAFLIITSVAGFAIFAAAAQDLPQITALKNYKPPVGTQIFSEDDHLIGRLKVDKGIFVPSAQIPDMLKKAAIAVEDARFYEHGGIDYQGILRAFVKDVISVSLKEGGSTITQQLAKVIFLTQEKTMTRKVKEIMLARQIEQKLTKDEILELYLNKIYFGHGAYGVEMAARTYFGKHVGDLNLGECAMIAGLIRSPSNYSPYNKMENARRRQSIVLDRMVKEKYISQGQKDVAYAQTMTLKNLRSREEVAPHLVEQLRVYLEGKYGEQAVYYQGLKVTTTIDYNMQMQATQALEEGVRALDKRQGFRGPLAKKTPEEMKKFLDDPPASETSYTKGEYLTGTVIGCNQKAAIVSARGVKGQILLADMIWAAGKQPAKKKPIDILQPGFVVGLRIKSFDKVKKLAFFTLEQEPLAQGALVAMDPWEGKVKAMVGGPDFTRNEYNHATLARRQPGSAFKPFVYASALEAGFTPASIINDELKSYDDQKWNPKNFDGEYYGPTRLRDALVFSRNTVTIELLHQVGLDRVIEMAQKLGMPGPFVRDLTLALGSCGVTPVELTSAYCSFANGGYSVKPVTIIKVTDASGRVLESNETQVEQVMSTESAYQVTSILEDVVHRGTARLASYLARPVAGKTGTTNDYKDAWFVGFVPKLVAGVWIGNDDHSTLGHGESGSRAALPVWVSFMNSATSRYAPDEFQVPAGVSLIQIDSDTGLLPTGDSRKVVGEYFKTGTEPTEYAPPPEINAAKPEDTGADDKIKKIQAND